MSEIEKARVLVGASTPRFANNFFSWCVPCVQRFCFRTCRQVWEYKNVRNLIFSFVPDVAAAARCNKLMMEWLEESLVGRHMFVDEEFWASRRRQTRLAVLHPRRFGMVRHLIARERLTSPLVRAVCAEGKLKTLVLSNWQGTDDNVLLIPTSVRELQLSGCYVRDPIFRQWLPKSQVQTLGIMVLQCQSPETEQWCPVWPISLERLKIDVLPRHFPERLVELDLKLDYSKALEPGQLPSSLRKLGLRDEQNRALEPGVLPHGLQELVLVLDQPLHKGLLPTTLRRLKFGGRFNQAIGPGQLPEGLTELHFGSFFDQPLVPGVLPTSLRSLSFGTGTPPAYSEFKQPLGVGVLPHGLQWLSLPSTYDVDDVVLPSSLVRLCLDQMMCNRPPPYLRHTPASLQDVVVCNAGDSVRIRALCRLLPDFQIVKRSTTVLHFARTQTKDVGGVKLGKRKAV